MNLPKNSPDGQLLSYKFHHRASGRQLLDEETLAGAGVQQGDVLRLQPEITAGSFEGDRQQGVVGRARVSDVLRVANAIADDRFSRFELIGWWEQERLAAAKVLLLGAGALGNEILKNLALLGVGRVYVADLDTVENSNLSRSVLFREQDCGRPKAEVVAERARDVYPEMQIAWSRATLFTTWGLGFTAGPT